MKNKRILCSGSNGFIGQAIIKRLQAENSILTITRADYYLPGFKEKLTAFNPNYIINCAAFGNHFTQQDDQEIFEANVVKLFLLLQATQDISYDGFINFGSSSEYGQKKLPMCEVDFLEPLTMYGGTKAAGTMLARVFAKKYHKPIVTVRPFSVYGPGEADHRFIPTIIRSLVRDEEFPLDSKAAHDWIYIDDLVDGVLKVMELAKTLNGIAINIGTGKEYNNRAVVSLLTLITGQKPKIKELPLRPHDSSMWVADNSLLKLCKWKPKVELLAGLKRTYQYYKGLYENN